MTDLFTQDDQSEEAEIAKYMPGENNRYKTVEEIAKKGYMADRHIKTIEEENAHYRETILKLKEDNETKAKLEEYLDKITKAASASSRPASESITPSRDDQPTLDLKQIENYLNQREVSKTRENNVKAVTDALKERYGHNYVEVLNKQAEELGLDKQAVNYLAETAPKAFFKTLGLDVAPKTETFQTPPRQSALFAPKGQVEETWSFFQKMKKDNPSEYNNPRTQVRMHQAYMKLGKAFEDGDFLAHGQDSAF